MESDLRFWRGPLLGTISLKGTGVIKQVKEREDVEIFKLTPQNRDVLGQQVYRQLEKVLKNR
jgi:nucleoside-triphosphatase THEP1